MVAVPEVASASPSRTRSVVVLPAPLGPRKPRIDPDRTPKLSPSTATVSPYRLLSDSIAITPRRVGAR